MYGAYPSLTDLDDGDLKYTTDFRRVYATLLDRWLNADSSSGAEERVRADRVPVTSLPRPGTPGEGASRGDSFAIQSPI